MKNENPGTNESSELIEESSVFNAAEKQWLKQALAKAPKWFQRVAEFVSWQYKVRDAMYDPEELARVQADRAEALAKSGRLRLSGKVLTLDEIGVSQAKANAGIYIVCLFFFTVLIAGYAITHFTTEVYPDFVYQAFLAILFAPAIVGVPILLRRNRRMLKQPNWPVFLRAIARDKNQTLKFALMYLEGKNYFKTSPEGLKKFLIFTFAGKWPKGILKSSQQYDDLIQVKAKKAKN